MSSPIGEKDYLTDLGAKLRSVNEPICQPPAASSRVYNPTVSGNPNGEDSTGRNQESVKIILRFSRQQG
jgi:hypothetical protein